MTEEMEHISCCVCYEEDKIFSCITCDRCKDGIICIECIEEIQATSDSYSDDMKSYCPVCRSLLISYSLHTMVVNEWFYAMKHPTENNSLIQRWVDNGRSGLLPRITNSSET